MVSRVLWPSGTTQIALEQFRHLLVRNCRAELVFLRPGPGASRVDLYGLKVRFVRQKLGLFGPLWGFLTNLAHGVPEKGWQPADGALDLDSVARAVVAVLRLRPRAIICHDQFSGMVGLACHYLQGVNYITYLHESLYEDPTKDMVHLPSFGRLRVQRFASLVDEFVLGHSAIVLTNSRGTLESLRRCGYVGRAEVLFPGAPVVRQQNVPSMSKDPFVLAVATWDKARFPEKYMEVASKLNKGRLVLAGMWRYGYKKERDEFVRKIKLLGLEERLEVTGAISQTELDSLFERASVFLRFGFEEYGPGMGCLAALSWGLPVVANRPLGITEVIRSGFNGVVLDSVDPTDAAAAIDRLLGDPNGLRNLRVNAKQTAKELSWTVHADLLSKFVDEAIMLRCPACIRRARKS